MTCTHTVTQGRSGETGSWCTDCGVKVFEVDERECKGCIHAIDTLRGWICNRHLMFITDNMRVTYKIEEGSCWRERTPTTREATP